MFGIYTNCNKCVTFLYIFASLSTVPVAGKITDSHTTYKGKLRGPLCPPSGGGVVRQLRGCAACQAPDKY